MPTGLALPRLIRTFRRKRLPPFKPAWAIGRMLISTSIPVPNMDLTALATNHIMRRKPRSRGNVL